MTGHTRFRKVPRRAKDKPSVGMTNLTTYDNKTSSKNIHTHAKPGSAFFLYLTQPGSTMKGVLGL
jgi:hypothetical protein